MARASLQARTLLAAQAALLAVGCATPSAYETDRPVPQEQGDSAKAAAKADARARNLAAAERKVAQADRALELTRLEGLGQVGQAREELRAAEFELQEALTALEAHESASELRTRRARHEIAKAESRVVTERADLAGLQRVYAAEPEVLVKEEILRRSQMDVVFAEEELELSQLELARLLEVELDTERRELAEKQRAAHAAVQAKTHALEEAELDAKKSQSDAESDLMEAHEKVSEVKSSAEEDA